MHLVRDDERLVAPQEKAHAFDEKRSIHLERPHRVRRTNHALGLVQNAFSGFDDHFWRSIRLKTLQPACRDQSAITLRVERLSARALQERFQPGFIGRIVIIRKRVILHPQRHWIRGARGQKAEAEAEG